MTPEDVISYSNPNSALITPLGLMNPDRFGKQNSQEEFEETIEVRDFNDDYYQRKESINDGIILIILIISLVLLFLWGMVLKNDD